MFANQNHWPEIRPECRPWTRWWWPGSAVDKANISRLLRVYHDAGMGGVELTSIYHLRDSAKPPLDYLSPEWLEMVRHTIATAGELGMQVDLPPGSG
ncbi:MAG: glycosyl hydrolase, partial [Kiritimatiellia bacterium]